VTLRWTIVLPSMGCSPVAFDVLRAPGTSGGTFAVIGRTGLVDTFADTTVTPSTAYRYQVQSRSADGRVSTPSNTVTVTTPEGCTPSLPMGNLTVTGTSATSVSLSWAGPTSAACWVYEILRAPAAGGAFALVGTTTGLAFTNTGLTPSTAYRYIVQGRIVTTGALWGTTNVVVATTTQGCLLVPPPAPGNLTATSVSATTVALTWAVTAAPGCSFTYDILRATGPDGTFSVVGTASGNSFVDTGLTPATAYRYQARTRDAAGNTSALSNTVAVTTASAPGCAAAFRIVSSWSGGFQGEVTITNLSAATSSGWTATVTLSGATISAIWGGRTSQTTSPYTVTNETWNGVLAPNGTAVFGFNAAMTGTGGASATVACTIS
jgi:hypothetical protein